jgi:hypothetical protein
MVRACMAKRSSAPLSHDCDACAGYDGDDDGAATHLPRSCRHYKYIHRRGVARGTTAGSAIKALFDAERVPSPSPLLFQLVLASHTGKDLARFSNVNLLRAC